MKLKQTPFRNYKTVGPKFLGVGDPEVWVSIAWFVDKIGKLQGTSRK